MGPTLPTKLGRFYTMKITFDCDCGKHFEVDSAKAGKKGKCPQCGILLTTPGAPTPVAVATKVVTTPVAPVSPVVAAPLATEGPITGLPRARFWARLLARCIAMFPFRKRTYQPKVVADVLLSEFIMNKLENSQFRLNANWDASTNFEESIIRYKLALVLRTILQLEDKTPNLAKVRFSLEHLVFSPDIV